MKTTQCRKCGCTINFEPCLLGGREFFSQNICQPCADAQARAVAAERAADHQRRLLATWGTICPPEYDCTDPARLPDPGLLDRVMRWQYGPQGLMLHGETGTGKTRCAYALAKREHLAGRKVCAVGSFQLACYPAKLMENAGKAASWLAERVHADILLIDDAFKAKLSERVEEALFCLVEERTANRRPIIATTNDTGASLVTRLSGDRAEPLIRRLREFCHTIACRGPHDQ